MDEKLELKDFDIIGIIDLNDVHRIEKYTTPIVENGHIKGYLSRSKEYYNVKNMTELALEREELKSLLGNELTKRNFVILENMLNCSGKVYFKKFEEYIKSGKDENLLIDLKQAEKCLIDDITNILVILKGEGEINLFQKNILPVGMENSNKRSIEMDNKAILYIFSQLLKLKKDPQNIEIITPGYGSLYIGPFLKAMYGYNFTNTLKSKYIEDSMRTDNKNISSLMSSDRAFEEDKIVLLLDDNVGTGNTINEIKKELSTHGVPNVMSGALQFNWRNYLRVSTGEKKDIDRFNIDDFVFLSPLNYAGHKLYEHAIDSLHSSGSEYIEYLNSKSYRLNGYPDIQGILDRGVYCARQVGIELADGYTVPIRHLGNNTEILEKYKNESTEITNPISKKIVTDMRQKVNDVISVEKSISKD